MESHQKRFWIILACTQIIGILCAPFANVHSNVPALLATVLLLLPGNLVAGALLELLPGFATCLSKNELGCVLVGTCLSAVLNVTLWYGLRTAIGKRRAHTRANSQEQ